MSTSSWKISRRTCLQGLGVSLGLPLLDGMVHGEQKTRPRPKRMCCVYFPFGVAMPKDGTPDRPWGWFPTGQGADYQLTNPLKPLAALRNELTVLGGLSHPRGRSMGGHDTGDTFLTGAKLSGSSFSNTVSMDQYAAAFVGDQTRFPSLTLSSDGGVGEPTRSTTLSFTRTGRPVPALASPQQIFNRLFGAGDGSTEAQRRRLEQSGSLLDLLLENSKSLKHRLGTRDKKKLDDYLASVRAVEKRVQQSQRWLSIPKPKIDPKSIDLAVDQDAPREYLRAMYDLLFLAFQTDTTRLATYMIGQVAGATTIANAFPACIGLKGNWHGLAHGAGKVGGAERLGRFDQFLAEQFGYFLQRLNETPEGDGTLLDHTLVLYGSSNSRTHQNRNYPLVLAGGTGLGLKHGHYRRYGNDVPLSNLFVTMLDRIGVPVEGFADSTAEMSDLLA